MNENHPLYGVNKSELIQMARSAGLGNPGRDLSREELIELLETGDEKVEDRLERWRRAMQEHIKKNRRRMLSQLPNCNGKCRTFGCPDVVVTRCWRNFSKDMV